MAQLYTKRGSFWRFRDQQSQLPRIMTQLQLHLQNQNIAREEIRAASIELWCESSHQIYFNLFQTNLYLNIKLTVYLNQNFLSAMAKK